MEERSVAVAGFSRKQAYKLADDILWHKQNRNAREALREILLFNDQVNFEIRQTKSQFAKGTPFDPQLLKLLEEVSETFNATMLKLKGSEDGPDILMVYADKVQDLMSYIHSRRN